MSVQILLNHLKKTALNNKIFLLALAVSLLLHILLMTKFEWHLPNLAQEVQGLEVRLTPLPASSAVIAEAALPEQPPPLPEVVPTEVVHEVVPDIQAEPVAPETALPLDPQVVSQSAEAGQPLPTRPETTPYQYVETIFDIKLNASALPNQQADATDDVVSMTFRIDKNGTYMLTAHTRIVSLANKNLAALNNMKQMSEGVVTKEGLIPGSYLRQKQGDTHTAKYIRFIWQDGLVQFKSAGKDNIEPLATGALDELSVLYQFMFLPPVNTAQITMAGEVALGVADFSVKAPEEISTEFGQLRTLHLVNTNTHGIWQEIWLAMDYQYLPVKMVKKLENGDTLQLTVKNMLTTAF